MSEGFSSTSTSGSTYPPAAAEPQPASFGAPNGNGEESSTTDAAKKQAGQVAQTAKHAGTQVAGTVKEQAGAVTAEVGHQARNLLNQTRGEIADQASTQQQRVAGGLHSLADEIQGLLDGEPRDGMASDLARTASDKAHEIADWLDRRDPASLLEEVRSYARRRPGVYLAVALGAGILAGRLTRGLTASNDGDQQSGGQQSGGRRRAAVTGGHGDAGTGYSGTATAGIGYAGAGGDGQPALSTIGYGQDDALPTAGDVPAVEAVAPVEGIGATGGTLGDLTR